MINSIKKFFSDIRAKRQNRKLEFEKIMKRFDTPKHVRNDIEQGEKVSIILEDKQYTFMYLYSHLDNDYFLRLHDNNIVVYPSSKINFMSISDN